MTSPRTLFASIAATVCAFALALVVIASQASIAATPVVGPTQALSTAAVVAPDANHGNLLPVTAAQAPAASR
jgi:hypothetical protein